MNSDQQPRTPYEELWLEVAAPHAQFLCRSCGVMRDFVKTDTPCLYTCPVCGRDIDERSTWSRVKLSRWESYR